MLLPRALHTLLFLLYKLVYFSKHISCIFKTVFDFCPITNNFNSLG